MTLIVENRGDRVCRLQGYARLRLRDMKGRLQPTTVVDGPTYFQQDLGPKTVSLRPGGFATASVGWSAVPGPGENQYRCEPSSAWLDVALPYSSHWQRVPFQGGPICSRGRLVIDAFRAA